MQCPENGRKDVCCEVSCAVRDGMHCIEEMAIL